MYLSICNNGCQKVFPSDRGDCPHCGMQEALCDSHPIDNRYYGYDIETFPNIFTCRFIHAATGNTWRFEISDRMHQGEEFVQMCFGLKSIGGIAVGYNNIGFDYPVVHAIINNPLTSVGEIYNIAQAVLKDKFDKRFAVWPSDWVFDQLDLFKIHHFDNKSKATSLKQLEMWMNLPNVGDLPFPVGTVLDNDQKETLHEYNFEDVDATLKFLARSLSMIELRSKMSTKFKMNFNNCSDIKMGEMILISEMEKAGIKCYEKVNGRKVKRQTFRESIPLKDVIFDYVQFERPEFQELKTLIESRTIHKVEETLKTKGLLKGVVATVDGLEYKIGTGGIHASVESCSIHTTGEMQIIDVDVEGFYPSLASANRYYPEHLGVEFCTAYDGIGTLRAQHPKKTFPMENGAFKLARNGAYGNSNNKFSPLFDPKYTMITTINGQSLLCMLVEQLVKIPNLRMIQANTDGVTYLCPKNYIEHSRKVCKWWEQYTQLTLEEVFYKSMYIRDVNNYMAVKEDDSVKRIGCYAHVTEEESPGTRELPWHKDWSQRVVALAAEAALVRGECYASFIMAHGDKSAFTMRAKVPRSSQLVMRREGESDEQLQNIIRYYVSVDGGSLFKISPPTGEPGTWKRKPKTKVTDETYHAIVREIMEEDKLGKMLDSSGTPHDERIHTKNKSKHETRTMAMGKGWLATDCSKFDDFDWSTLNYEYYIEECRKIVEPLLNDF